MKNFVFILLFLVAVSAQSQTSIYHPFPDSNAVWNGQFNMGLLCSYGENYSYIIGGDTIIEINNYHKLFIPYVMRYGDTLCALIHTTGYVGCYRNDHINKKVFYINPNDSVENLLYDFSLQVGGVTPAFSRWGCIVLSDTITTIDSAFIGTNYRKVWVVGTPPFTYSIIEGIGYSSGLLDGCGGYLDGPSSQLECFQQNDITLFPDSSSSCSIITIVAEEYTKEKLNFKIYPNPTTGGITVELTLPNTTPAELRAYGSYGSLQSQYPLQKGFNKIEIPAGKWDSGVSIVGLYVNGKQVLVEKVVKN